MEGQDCPLGFGVVMLFPATPWALGHIPCAPSAFPTRRVGAEMWIIPMARCCSPVERGQAGARVVRGCRGSVGRHNRAGGGLGAAELTRVLSAHEQ